MSNFPLGALALCRRVERADEEAGVAVIAHFFADTERCLRRCQIQVLRACWSEALGQDNSSTAVVVQAVVWHTCVRLPKDGMLCQSSVRVDTWRWRLQAVRCGLRQSRSFSDWEQELPRVFFFF